LVSTAKQAADIIAGAAKNNADDARAAVLKVLAGLSSSEPPAAVLLEIAELVRPSVDYVVFEYRASYADRALPFGELEARRFGNAMGLLDHLEALYRRVLDAAGAAPASEASSALRTQAMQRCMACVVSRMIEHYRARQTVEAGLWNRLQRHMRAAAVDKLDRTRVADTLDPRGKVAPLGAYSQALLLSIAQAGAMTQRNLEASIALSAMFADLVESTILENPPGAVSSAGAAPQTPADGVGIKRTGRIRVVDAGGITHLVNTTRIDAAMAQVMQKLGAGQSAEAVGLGSVSQADLANLLPRLRRIWCGAGEIRETQRIVVEKPARVAVGFSGISTFVDPNALVTPQQFEIWDYHKGAAHSGKSDVVLEKDRELPPEDWHIHDHSTAGMRAKRHGTGARLRRNQLLAVQFIDAQQGPGFTLGEFRWLQQHADVQGGISAGVRFLSNRAHVVLIRIHGLQRGQYQSVGPAFVYPDLTAEHLVLPYGWYAEKRDADLWHASQIVPINLTGLKSRGADYEIVTYERRTA
jgi:hypothetical protein